MQVRCLWTGARSAAIEIVDGGRYETNAGYDCYLNHKFCTSVSTAVVNLFHLLPDTEYTLDIRETGREETSGTVFFRTFPEYVTLNVRAFGAVGDGIHEDTASLQAAILACPPNSRVLVPAGTYLTGPLFLKSDLNLELAKGATLKALTDPERYPLLPGRVGVFERPVPDWRDGAEAPLAADRPTTVAGQAEDLASEMADCIAGEPGKKKKMADRPGSYGAVRSDKIERPAVSGYTPADTCGCVYPENEYLLGSWEGNPLESRAPILTALYCRNVTVYGEGVIDGCGTKETWYRKETAKTLPARPRTFFASHCENVVIQGLTVKRSPAWTIHPYFTKGFMMLGTTIQNPADSPNTDGFDPESCRDVVCAGVHFSLGDDCIAVKSGKIYMGSTYRTPCEHVRIFRCLMENGHGAVTLGSEMAGGIRDLTVENCVFRNTDRGLRVKTRRGRGKDAVLDKILMRNISMEGVAAPIVVNSFYFCDPDGHTSYVQDRSPRPVDAGTPEIRSLEFTDIEAKGCRAQAAWIAGLPESKIGRLCLKNVHISFAENPEAFVPAMAEGVNAVKKKGFYCANVHELVLEDVTVSGAEGTLFKRENVDRCTVL